MILNDRTVNHIESDDRKPRTIWARDLVPWIGAILLGALVPALIVAGQSGQIAVLPIAFAVTLGHSVVLGLPIALVYRAKLWIRPSAAIAGGFLIGMIPGAWIAWPMSLSLHTRGSVDGIPTIIDGVPTWAGWGQYVEFLGMLGSFGAIGGLVFWVVLKWCGTLEIATPRPVGAESIRKRSGSWLAGGAVLAAFAVALVPSLTKDRTCHNMFRDGRSSVSPKLDIDLDVAINDWPVLARLLEEFANSRGMSFRNTSHGEALAVSACTDAGPVITVYELRWASHEQGIPITVYDLSDGISWQLAARDLVAALASRWPGKVRFRDGGGRLVSEPAFLVPSE
ncbi:MAG: hypothetical protein JWL84_6362 [Rhodospirillales bacterium]|nr:hypothetical protein [Rhodospirillales bacterium]